MAGIEYQVNGMWFRESFAYTDGGAVTKKKLRIDKSGTTGNEVEATYTVNNEGRVTTMKYPDVGGTTGRTFNYGFDAMARPVSMVDSAVSWVNWLQTVSYNPAGQVTAMAGVTYGYNTLNQLTSISGGGFNGAITYNYKPNNNNGRIESMTDNWGTTTETVTYGYDSLNRLTSASSTASWNASYTYDGFGNLLTKSGNNAPYMNVSVNPATNRTDPFTDWDANGNKTIVNGFSTIYDIENRMVQYGANVSYGYGSDNKRVYKKVNTTEEVYFYGVEGRRIATYSLAVNGSALQLGRKAEWYLLGGKTIKRWDGLYDKYVYTDRLGSVVHDQDGFGFPMRMKYFPYGEERTATTGDRDKFGTYYRDAESGLDNADQRNYPSASGRFSTSDRYEASGGAGEPGSWNRYAYVVGDPVNFIDPTGEIAKIPTPPGGVFNPVSPFVFVINVFLQLFGRDTQIRNPDWQTDTQVNSQVGARERAFWKDHEDDRDDPIQDPMFLKVVEDCYVRQVAKSGSLVRRRRYQVLDEWGRAMLNPGSLQVTERHDVRFSPSGFVTGGAWGRRTRSPLTPQSMFDDYLSTGSGGDIWTYQSFNATATATSRSRPLMIIDGANWWTTLGIHMTHTRININGNDGPYENGKLKECDTPPL